MTHFLLGACQISLGSRPACLTTGLPSYSVHERPRSLLNAMHSPRPVLVNASTSGGSCPLFQPEVLSLSTTVLPEKHQSPNCFGYSASGNSFQWNRSLLA